MSIMKHPERTTRLLAISVFPVALVALASAQLPKQTPKLPEAAEQSLREMFPNARIVEVQHERRIVRLIDVTVIANGEERDLILTQDGTILSVEQEIEPDKLPTLVRNAAQDVAGQEKLIEADRIKVLADFRAVALDEPRTEYAAAYGKKGKHEIILSEDGAILQTQKRMSLEEKHQLGLTETPDDRSNK